MEILERLRMRAPYVNPDEFDFTIYRKGILSEIGKWFGMQDVIVGDPAFDEIFIIKGNDENRLKKLFSDPKIRNVINTQPDILFSIRNDEQQVWRNHFPQGVDELYLQTGGVVKDIDRLKLIYELFSETLDELCRTEAAYEKSSTVELLKLKRMLS